MAINFVTIEGNNTRDPELRFSKAGNAVCSGSIAYNERVLVDGQWEDGDPTFVDWVIFKDQAENIAESIEKGDRVLISGRLSMDTFVANHVRVDAHKPGKNAELMALLGPAMALISSG